MLYDPEANIISLPIGKGKITHTSEFGNFIIHLSDAKKPILIEILDASKFMGQFDKIKNVGDIKKMLPTINQLN
ncbi:MAG: hypothetical protein US83_C0005G0058 [Candidatus Falkowbacteria bacterium GW2011_GWC2_38_22]|uniref:Uncharacterized protein n=1 Tax=Candidatus Falkowbacteria bacterium GW2011_GWE1_38_31 TaxID=1618638 RepID=A0A0G0MZP9_9BACT|nr:MAG: hypothetical protein US73_C0003G0036 [Candidatus Falkowbacteria bacterium GW2011_GWF2_38_1205]KKQ61545.1 MAG: hypothetical protein US83_C0005G0058 [Candidatus Falkowbacteria bacterium GW2011_GWC2_38_22]KKQ63562.1 MAG: hypothetical protein US84_C0005G0036 [Candidatus Falkowbacteria bacterium GW2011_GWF1_38_22]KKQ65714.1 MAG: hypothetical protein US87_C0005G0036 [Candidatus Falkowbacteria bacterium GW2011_GWE2_38_254]KKQ70331.1 MAG: hypothetical protein US91_C0005G0036 [Candidatus Falkowb